MDDCLRNVMELDPRQLSPKAIFGIEQIRELFVEPADTIVHGPLDSKVAAAGMRKIRRIGTHLQADQLRMVAD